MLEAGLDNIMRWVPFDIDAADLRNRIRNKMIRPTTIPQTMQELIIEQAIAREALRLAFEHHKSLAVGLRGVQTQRDISEAFDQSASGGTLVNLRDLGMIVGSGGVLSHAPRRAQSALMMLDAFVPEFVTQLAVDSIFMMPHLGVLSTVNPVAAQQVFDRDCLIRLGTAIAPVGIAKEGEECVTVKVTTSTGKTHEVKATYGSMHLIPLAEDETADVIAKPARNFELGKGKGHEIHVKVEGGTVGLIIDARGREPLGLPTDKNQRIRKLVEWYKALDVYPMDILEKYLG